MSGNYITESKDISEFFSMWIHHCQLVRNMQGQRAGEKALERIFEYLSRNMFLLEPETAKEIKQFYKQGGEYECTVETVKNE